MVSKIHTIVDKVTGNLYALNYINSSHLIEVDIHSRLIHPHIMSNIKFVEIDNCTMGMVFPLADRCLCDIMHINMTTRDKLPILYKVARALEFLHRNRILHLNINLNNVVLEGIHENYPYLIDYHQSMIVDNIHHGRHDSSVRGTLDYLAPEIFNDHMYTSAVDIWAFGIMTAYLLSESTIYPIIDINLPTLIINTFTDPHPILSRLLTGISSEYSSLCYDFLSKVLVIDPKQRLNAQELCIHPLFDKCRSSISEDSLSGSTISPLMSNDYSDDNREIIKVFVISIAKWFPNERAELLFLAVDLYYRVSSFYKNHSHSDRILLTATCLWMAFKFISPPRLSDYLSLFSDISLTYDILCTMENEIIKHLNGILYTSTIYTACTTGDQLRVCLPIILHSDNTYYSQMSNETEILMSYLNTITTTIYPTKDITIKMLEIL